MNPYPNPPITEALIDIRIEPLPKSALATLESLHDAIRDDYPVKKQRTGWEGSVGFRDTQLVSFEQRHVGPDGFLFLSQDEKQIVQCRLDGFTFNRLRPYPGDGWPIIRNEARKIWEHYLHSIARNRIIHIGLRYINQIDIPGRQIQLEDYFTEPPRVPKSLPQTFNHFLTRFIIVYPELEAKAIITQSLVQPSAHDKTSFIFDIDVLKEPTGSLGTANVWDVLEHFRECKNTIFEASLTNKTKELFQ